MISQLFLKDYYLKDNVKNIISNIFFFGIKIVL